MNKIEKLGKQIARRERDWMDENIADMFDNAWELTYVQELNK